MYEIKGFEINCSAACLAQRECVPLPIHPQVGSPAVMMPTLQVQSSFTEFQDP